MEKRKGIIGRVVLIVIIYSLLTHWGDFKRGVIDGFNNVHTTAINATSAK